MSRHRRREIPRDNGGVNGLLDGLNLADIMNILSKVDINKISSIINNTGNVPNVKSGNQPKARVQRNTEANAVVETKDAPAANSREEIAKAIKILVNADRELLIEVVGEIFGKDSQK